MAQHRPRIKEENYDFYPQALMATGYYGLEVPNYYPGEAASESQVFIETLVGGLLQNGKPCSKRFKIIINYNRIKTGNNNSINFTLTVTLGKHTFVSGTGFVSVQGQSFSPGYEVTLKASALGGRFLGKDVALTLKMVTPNKGIVTIKSTWM